MTTPCPSCLRAAYVEALSHSMRAIVAGAAALGRELPVGLTPDQLADDLDAAGRHGAAGRLRRAVADARAAGAALDALDVEAAL